jgi:hypothetical protein
MRERGRVWINGADDDSAMGWPLVVESHEMPAVMRQEYPSLANRKCQHVEVGYSLPCPAAFGGRQNIVPQPPKLFDRRKREVLVGVDADHPLRPFVFGNLPVDFFAMRLLVGPGVDEILRS